MNILSAVFLQKSVGFYPFLVDRWQKNILSAMFLGLAEYSKCDVLGHSKCSRV